jgi:hypothetical protein
MPSESAHQTVTVWSERAIGDESPSQTQRVVRRKQTVGGKRVVVTKQSKDAQRVELYDPNRSKSARRERKSTLRSAQRAENRENPW